MQHKKLMTIIIIMSAEKEYANLESSINFDEDIEYDHKYGYCLNCQEECRELCHDCIKNIGN